MEPKNYSKYDRARKKVKAIKGFYNHLWVFLFVNCAILIVRFYVLPSMGIISDDEGFNNWLNVNTFITPSLWGVVLIIHGIKVNGFRFFRDWEDQKIKELMEDDDVDATKWN